MLNGDDVDHLVEIAGVDRDAAGELGDAAVAGSAEDFRDLRGFAESPDDCVLAAASADYQNFHPSILPHSASPVRYAVRRLYTEENG